MVGESHRSTVTVAWSMVTLTAAAGFRILPSASLQVVALVVVFAAAVRTVGLFNRPLDQLHVSAHQLQVGQVTLGRGEGDQLVVVAGPSVFGHVCRRLVMVRDKMPVRWVPLRHLRARPDVVMAALVDSGWPVRTGILVPAPQVTAVRSVPVPAGAAVTARAVRVAGWAVAVAVAVTMSVPAVPFSWARLLVVGAVTGAVAAVPTLLAGLLVGWRVLVGVSGDGQLVVTGPAGTFTVALGELAGITASSRGLWVHARSGERVRIAGPVRPATVGALAALVGPDVPVHVHDPRPR